MGEALSGSAELEKDLADQAKEIYEIDNYFEGEKQELKDKYIASQMSEEDATLVTDILFQLDEDGKPKYKDFVVDVMMASEIPARARAAHARAEIT